MSIEPRAVTFPGPEAGEEQVCRVLVFADSSPLDSPHPASPAPTALQFETGPPSSNAAPSEKLTPLVFPEKREPLPPVVPPGRPAFYQPDPPYLAEALAHLAQTHPEEFVANKGKLRALALQLLPVQLEVIENWAEPLLRESREIAVNLSIVAQGFTALRGADTLSEILQEQAPAEGLVQKLTKKPPNLQLQSKALSLLRKGLQEAAKNARELSAKVSESKGDLVLALMALRAVSVAVPVERRVEIAVDAKIETIRGALNLQTMQISAQLQGIEDLAALQLSQCDKLLNFTIPMLQAARRG